MQSINLVKFSKEVGYLIGVPFFPDGYSERSGCLIVYTVAYKVSRIVQRKISYVVCVCIHRCLKQSKQRAIHKQHELVISVFSELHLHRNERRIGRPTSTAIRFGQIGLVTLRGEEIDGNLVDKVVQLN